MDIVASTVTDDTVAADTATLDAVAVAETAPLLRRHRLTVGEYHRMAETGVLAPDARVELIRGEIVDMAPIGTKHGSAVMRLTHLLVAAVGDAAIVSVQNALVLGDHSEPEPDVMLLAPRDDFYASAHPVPADVLLLVEVSDTTARYDRLVKLGLYARHGVREVWIVDLDHGLFRRYRRPQGDVYTEVTETAQPGVVAVEALPHVSIDTAVLLR